MTSKREPSSERPGRLAGSSLALEFSEEAIALLTGSFGKGWKELGRAAPGADDFDKQIGRLKAEAEDRAPAGSPIRLLLPPDQVLTRRYSLSAAQVAERRQEARRRIGEDSEFGSDDLSIAVGPAISGRIAPVLAVLVQTMAEARDYAEEWGFKPGAVSTRVEADSFGDDGPVFIFPEDEPKPAKPPAAKLPPVAVVPLKIIDDDVAAGPIAPVARGAPGVATTRTVPAGRPRSGALVAAALLFGIAGLGFGAYTMLNAPDVRQAGSPRAVAYVVPSAPAAWVEIGALPATGPADFDRPAAGPPRRLALVPRPEDPPALANPVALRTRHGSPAAMFGPPPPAAAPALSARSAASARDMPGSARSPVRGRAPAPGEPIPVRALIADIPAPADATAKSGRDATVGTRPATAKASGGARVATIPIAPRKPEPPKPAPNALIGQSSPGERLTKRATDIVVAAARPKAAPAKRAAVTIVVRAGDKRTPPKSARPAAPAGDAALAKLPSNVTVPFVRPAPAPRRRRAVAGAAAAPVGKSPGNQTIRKTPAAPVKLASSMIVPVRPAAPATAPSGDPKAPDADPGGVADGSTDADETPTKHAPEKLAIRPPVKPYRKPKTPAAGEAAKDKKTAEGKPGAGAGDPDGKTADGKTAEGKPAAGAGTSGREGADGTAKPDEDAPTKYAATTAPKPPRRRRTLQIIGRRSVPRVFAPTSIRVPRSVTAAASRTGLELKKTSLIGVFDLSTGRKALVRTATGSVKRLARGDSLEGWRVTAINRESMRLTKGGRNRTLLLIVP